MRCAGSIGCSIGLARKPPTLDHGARADKPAGLAGPVGRPEIPAGARGLMRERLRGQSALQVYCKTMSS